MVLNQACTQTVPGLFQLNIPPDKDNLVDVGAADGVIRRLDVEYIMNGLQDVQRGTSTDLDQPFHAVYLRVAVRLRLVVVVQSSV